ncbi:RebB family R body protein [Azospirillum rugosum]
MFRRGTFHQAAGQAFSLTMQNAASNQQNLNALTPSLVANAPTRIIHQS